MFRFASILLVIFLMGPLSGCRGTDTPDPSSTWDPNIALIEIESAATLSGTVRLTGQAPEARRVSMRTDPVCHQSHEGEILSDEIVLGEDGLLKNALVFISQGLEGKPVPRSAQKPVLDQIGCRYVPRVLAVQAGQPITIRNSDNTFHNVNARPQNNRSFNFGQPAKGMETLQSFSNAEMAILFRCDVHPWMRSFVSVFDHPYYAVTGEDGSFSITNLSPGSYELQVWHEIFGTLKKEISVGPNETATFDFAFEGSQ